jgi:hypothetical protein
MSRRGIALAAVAGVALTMATVPTASAAPPAPTKPAPPPTSAASIPDSQRDQVLPKDWRSANDRAVTTDGDSTGLHVLVADAKDGYTWRTAATLSEPGTETDQWIADSCVTGSGNRAVVVYATRQMVNSDDGFQRGGLVAIVDLTSGAVTKLPMRASLAYYNPGCGAGEDAVVTENFYANDKYVSRLMTVDAATGKVTRSVDADGQITSSVPVNGNVLAAKGSLVVSVDGTGAEHQLLETHGTPFRLGVDGQGGVGYEVRTDKDTQLHRIVGSKDSLITTVKRDSVQLHQVAGKLFVQGQDAKQAVAKTKLPAGWQAVNTAADAQLSTSGGLAVTSSNNVTGKASTPGVASPVAIKTTVLATGAHPAFTVTPQALRPAAGVVPSPGVGTPKQSAKQQAVTPNDDDPSTDTTDPDRKCVVPRNDPRIQSLQPTPQMAEWAADLAVQGKLTVGRGIGWNGSALPAYTPQGLFPPHALIGGGQVPAQILLGVMAQESNMWQAGPDTVDGESGNFEQGGFYGSLGTIDIVDFPNADCGYGVTQVTTGMSVGEQVYNSTQQLALTVDYAANIAAGLEILQDKWNQMKQLGVLANNADPSKLENWWFALWAYNSGWHDQGDPNGAGAWGLGWTNNMANEDLMPDRAGFLDASYDDAKTPNKWTYPERVMGWAFHSLVRINWITGLYGTTFETASWPTNTPPQRPDFGQFCQSANDCDMTQVHFPVDYPGDSGSHCLRDDLRCWWHQPVTWTDCSTQCGSQQLRYQGGAEPDPGASLYRPTCSAQADLPAGSLLIDDVPSGIRTNVGCAVQPTNDGTLTWKFNRGDGGFPAKIDFHQLDGGLNGHMWTAHAWSSDGVNADHGIVGTWTLDRQINGWARVLVYIPDHAAMAPQANYTVHGSDSSSPTRTVVEGSYLDDNRNVAPGHWASLGSFHFNGTPSVSLGNLLTSDHPVDGNFADGDRDIAWDAIAFQPLAGQPKDEVVGMGDSYASGEGASQEPVNGVWSYYEDSDHDGSTKYGDTPAWRDACHRSPYSWTRQATLSDQPGTSIGTRADDLDPTLDYHSTACSGAWTHDMTYKVNSDGSVTHNFGQYYEGAQLDQGYLDQYTSVVTLSVGGNDAKFIDVLGECASPIGKEPCQNAVISGDTQPLSQAEPDRINKVEPDIETVLSQIHTKAPNAKILLMGYPDFFSDPGTCLAYVSAGEWPWLNQMADAMDDVMATAAANQRSAGVNVLYADPRSDFVNKGICGQDQQINPLVLSLTRGDNPNGIAGLPVSAQSLHPTIGGATVYAGVAVRNLRLLGE